MAGNALYRYGFKEDANRFAEKYRAELRISKFDPLDAFVLAKHLKIPIFEIGEFKEDLQKDHFERLKNPDHFNGMWMPNSAGEKIIIHNNYHSPKRQQSNLMHELAHVILGHEISEEAAMLCALYGLHYFNKQQELEAKFLGSCLQITKPGLLWAIKRKNIEQISDYYNASIDMVQFRANSLGLARRLIQS
jgi:Zn-dependent peptidase ImmA (M78 family)